MMDSRVKTWTVQHQGGHSSKGLSYRESQAILKQAKLLGVTATVHPEMSPPYSSV